MLRNINKVIEKHKEEEPEEPTIILTIKDLDDGDIFYFKKSPKKVYKVAGKVILYGESSSMKYTPDRTIIITTEGHRMELDDWSKGKEVIVLKKVLSFQKYIHA
jgi:hypothetical protein